MSAHAGVRQHSLALVHRGEGHVHRWQPDCACGWSGIPRRRQAEAESQYRDHVQAQDRKRRNERLRPFTPTPADRVPEALREGYR